jgi:hypothetical protein
MDMYEKSLKMFLDEKSREREYASCFEITPSNLRPMVKLTNVISWTELNCCVRWDRTVMISNFQVLIVVEYFQTIPKQEWD